MEKIKVGFSRSSKKFAPFSWLIMASEHTNYSHVYVKFYSNSLQRWLIYQSSHTAVNFMGEELFNQEEIIVKEFDFTVSTETRVKMMNFCVDTIGKPYGTLSAFGLGIVQVASLVGIKMHNPFKKVGETYVCSQAIAALLEAGGIDIKQDIDDITPKELYPVVESLPEMLVA